jgi:hypothetical protein
MPAGLGEKKEKSHKSAPLGFDCAAPRDHRVEMPFFF